MKHIYLAVTMLAGLLLSEPGQAKDYKLGTLEIEYPWARATAEGAPNGAVFLDIKNEGGALDRLVSATSPVADKVELHTHISEDGVMKMRHIEAIDLVTGTEVKLAPGGLHLMLLGLKQPLQKGQSFPLTLNFEKAGSLAVEVAVHGLGDSKSTGDSHDHDDGRAGHDGHDGHDGAADKESSHHR